MSKLNSRFQDYSQQTGNIKKLAGNIVKSIHKKFEQIDRPLKIMHVCGTHEATVARSGMRALLPKDLRIIAGPGCPVCVCPAEHISKAAYFAEQGYMVTTFGDMFKVPDASLQTLAQTKAKGTDIRIVYSVREAIQFARDNPDRDIIWLGVGFETTAPMTSFVLQNNPPENFYVLSDFRLVPPALDFLLSLPTFDLDGFVLPGHVTTVMGTDQYKKYPTEFNVPCAVAGFDPVDFLVAMDKMLDQILENTPRVDNAYPRAVKPEGNLLAKESMNTVFRIHDAKWRGVGMIPDSGYYLSPEFEEHDADKLIDLEIDTDADLPKGCKCGGVILGQVDPTECPHFLRKCTPETAIGPCMVSDEGTCRIRATYREVLA
jgi:hydrogenase expression/formation protein HypD